VSTGPSADSTSAGPDVRPRLAPFLITAMLFAAVIPWRSKTFFDGQVDPVVAIKAVITVIALAAAVVANQHSDGDRKVPLNPVLALITYLTICLVGAFLGTTLVPTAVIVVRVTLVAWALTLTVTAYGIPVVTVSFIRVLQIVILVSVITNNPMTALSAMGSLRLRGAFPPLNPNELAHLSAACLLWATSRVLRAEEKGSDYLAIGWFLGIIFLTGSRTTLLAAIVGSGAMLLRARQLSIRGYIMAIASLPLVGYVILATDIVTSVLGRGGKASIGTLSNRTIAWQAALENPTTWHERLVGQGLSVKKIPVSGQWWQTQILDSSWVSALVQSGYLGLVVLSLWSLALLVLAFRTDHPWVTLWVGLSVYLISHSSLESGLFDASSAFLMFWILSLAVWGHGLEEPQPLPSTETRSARSDSGPSAPDRPTCR
jgi:hypothetical protein